VDDKDDCFRGYDSHSIPAAGAYPLTGRQELLNQSVREIQNALSGNGKLKINQKIRLKVRSLSENFGLERDEIENDAVEEFLSRELYEKCNPEKSLSTFCTHFVSYSLNGQLRKEKRQRKHHQTVSLDGLAQDTHDNDWAYSDEFLEPAGDESLADTITPEDFLHAKELLDLIIKHFGYDDAAVALGCKSRQAEAKRLNITHDAYCKRLQRKIGSFKIVLKKAGYL
jgi:hypothetical protein